MFAAAHFLHYPATVFSVHAGEKARRSDVAEAETRKNPPRGGHPANCSPIAMTLRDADRVLGLNITLHDLSGVFNVRDGGTLLDPARQSHRRFTVCRVGYCAECLAHCRDRIRQRSLTEQQPFVSSCWKGLTEVVVPIVRDDVLLAVLFAGPGRAMPRRRPPDAAARLAGAHARLSELDNGECGTAGGCSDARDGLVQRIEQAVLAECPTTARSDHAVSALPSAPDISVADLAAEMHLSPSRTSHLVKELFGAPFQDLVIRHRLQRALHFLRSTDLPVAAVGRRVGIENEYYFNRLFKRAYGEPPARYRRQFKQGTLLSET